MSSLCVIRSFWGQKKFIHSQWTSTLWPFTCPGASVNEQRHKISSNVVCGTSKFSDPLSIGSTYLLHQGDSYSGLKVNFSEASDKAAIKKKRVR